ncbi:MAG: DUF3887 domain-containing protein [Candidatus Eremiobacteraeota bacterium]|nr:DUF3887 domain-containing protein [Candidatus Eremiobacteraeota bacterium]
MKTIFAIIMALAIAACDHATGNEQKVADDVTQGVYNNDMSAVQANFTPDLAASVTRATVGDYSDKMHRLGGYQGLTETGNDIPRHLYIFDAKFDKGDMTVRIRMSGDGKVAAYRVTPGAPQ